MKSERTEGRRAFFRTFARACVFGALAAAAAVLGRRRRNPARHAPCSGDGYCPGCPALGGCRLPQALSVKNGRARTGRS